MNEPAISGTDVAGLGTAVKLIVMIERAPLSDYFVQIMLTQEQLREMKAALSRVISTRTSGRFALPINVSVGAGMRDVSETYDQTAIDQALL